MAYFHRLHDSFIHLTWDSFSRQTILFSAWPFFSISLDSFSIQSRRLITDKMCFQSVLKVSHIVSGRTRRAFVRCSIILTRSLFTRQHWTEIRDFRFRIFCCFHCRLCRSIYWFTRHIYPLAREYLRNLFAMAHRCNRRFFHRPFHSL
jgi:hypothetical protein